MNERQFRIGITLTLLCAVLLATAGAFTGCEMAHRIDEAVWGTDAAPAEDPLGTAPPILETLAAILAAGGFGGMSLWIRRARNSSRDELAKLKDQVDQIQIRIDREVAYLQKRDNTTPTG